MSDASPRQKLSESSAQFSPGLRVPEKEAVRKRMRPSWSGACSESTRPELSSDAEKLSAAFEDEWNDAPPCVCVLAVLEPCSRPRRFFSVDSPPPDSEEADRSC